MQRPLSLQHSSFYIFLLAVLALHGGFMVVKMQDHFSSVVTPSVPEIIKIKLVQEALQDKALSRKRQVVQSEESESAEKVDSAYLSDKDRKFDRQTVSRNTDTFQKAALGNAATTVKAQDHSRQKKKASLKEIKLSDVGMAGDPMPKEVSRSPASQSIKGMETGDPLSQGLSATNDYVEEVTLGDFTHLNTTEYKFYGFFHRIRQKLEQFWGQSIEEKANSIFRSGRRLPASENLITSLQITLDDRGEIVGVKILGTSGVKELDDAAIESFNKAGPFPNPPKDMLVNGKAVIEWGFVVKS